MWIRLCFVICIVLAVPYARGQQVTQPAVNVSYQREKRQYGRYLKVAIRTPVFPRDSAVGLLANQLVKSVIAEKRKRFLSDVSEHIERAKRYDFSFWVTVEPKVLIAKGGTR